MTNEQKIQEVKARLPKSEVFPEYIREMLLSELNGLAVNQLDLLLEILDEENRRLKAIS